MASPPFGRSQSWINFTKQQFKVETVLLLTRSSLSISYLSIMGFDYLPPEYPKNPGPFSVQHGYSDVQLKTQNYSGDCSPLSPTTQHRAGGFEKFAKNENTKKVGSFFLNQLKGFLIGQCT